MKELSNEIKAALGDYEVGTYDAIPLVTWGRSLRTSFDVKALNERHPDLAAAFVNAVPIRTLRLKKARAL